MVDRLRRIATVSLAGYQPLEQSVADAIDLLGESTSADLDVQRGDPDAALSDHLAVVVVAVFPPLLERHESSSDNAESPGCPHLVDE